MRLIIGENINCTLNICKTDNCTLIFFFFNCFSGFFSAFLLIYCFSGFLY
jgi:hypothetical protein